MDAFICTGAVFRHTIAAQTFEEALQVAQAELGGGRVVLWSTPDVWTCRAVEAATAPCVVDAVPRFVVERSNGFSGILELDHDSIPGNLRPGEADRLRQDSEAHAVWLDAFQAVHEGGEALRRLVVEVATCRDPERHKRLVRALAGAYGLGPVPAWHGAILPALVAADVEAQARGWETPDDWFELSPQGLLDVLQYWPENSPSRQLFGVVCLWRDEPVDTQERAAAFLRSLGWQA